MSLPLVRKSLPKQTLHSSATATQKLAYVGPTCLCLCCTEVGLSRTCTPLHVSATYTKADVIMLHEHRASHDST